MNKRSERRACGCVYCSHTTYSVPNAVKMSTEQDWVKSFLTKTIKSRFWHKNRLRETASLAFMSCLGKKHTVVTPWQQAGKAAGLIWPDGNSQYVNWHRAAFKHTHTHAYTFTNPVFRFNQWALPVCTGRKGRARIDQKAWLKLLQRLRGGKRVNLRRLASQAPPACLSTYCT